MPSPVTVNVPGGIGNKTNLVTRYVPQGSSANELLYHSQRAFDEIYTLFDRVSSLAASVPITAAKIATSPAAVSVIQQQLATVGPSGLNIYNVNNNSSGSKWGWQAYTIIANTITPNLALGSTHIVILNQSAKITINNPINISAVQPGQPVTLQIIMDGIGSRPTPNLGSLYLGVTGFIMTPAANTYSALNFQVGSNGSLYMTAPVLNGAPYLI